MPKIITTSLLLTCLHLLAACSTQQTGQEYESFKNTKKLMVNGHKSLYENGAFSIPSTSISLIPAGPSAKELAFELAGLHAPQAFSTSVKNAADSVSIISIGTQKTYDISESMFDGGQNFAQAVTDHSRPGGMLLLKRSASDSQYIISKSWDMAMSSAQYLIKAGDDLTQTSVHSAKSISNEGLNSTDRIFSESITTAKKVSSGLFDDSAKNFHKGTDAFIKGYMTLPSNLAKRASAMNPKPSWNNYVESAQDMNQWRKDSSDKMTFFVKDASSNYFSNIGGSFNKSKEALNETNKTGSLAVLKSLGWALHGVFWEGLIKPTTKITAGSLGYIAVNTVVYPVMLIGQSSVSLAEVAVKVTWNTGAMAYDFVAPTAKAVIAGVLSTTQATGAALAGGAIMTGGTIASGATLIGSQAVAATVATTGAIAGQTIKYVGVPLAASGIAASGTAVGVTVGVSEAVLGSTVLVAGEAASVGTQATSTVASAGTLVAGTAISTVGGIGYGIYELSKAVVVPTTYTLSSGLVLGYGATSQLAAHSILAVSDAAYCVLSMEGPNWVIYSVQGMVGNNERLAGGTVLDLENMQNHGEVFKRLPISEAEMNAVIENIPKDLSTISI